MKTLIFLCVFICWTNFLNAFVSPYKRSAQEQNEERIIVKHLASMIREKFQSREDGDDYDGQQLLTIKNDDRDDDDDDDDDDEDSGATNKLYSFDTNSKSDRNSVVDDSKKKMNKQPFAVPPTDSRYYEKDFSYEPKTLKAAPISDGTSIVNSIPSSNNAKKLSNETEDEIQRRKLYAHLTLNPSFIPYGQVQSIRIPPAGYYDDKNATHFLALTYGTVCAILVITSGAAYVFCRKLRKNVKDAEDVDYPAYGVTGPNKDAPAPTGDRHLARSAQMYHYQHQKQQIVAMEKSSSPTKNRKGTESGSEEDDLTVYECPGLAPVTGEMEVKNPMFQDEEEVRVSNASKESSNQKQTNIEVKKSSIK